MPIAAPTYRAEAVLSNDLTGFFRIGYGMLDADRLGGDFSSAGWTDLTDRWLSFECSRGRDDSLSGISAGMLQLIMDDADGALDPENAASAYYPNIKLLKRWRVVATYNGADYGLGYGFATDYAAEANGLTASVTVSASDLFTRMGRKRTPVTYPAQTFHERMHALLDELEWPTGDARAIGAAGLELPSETIGVSPTMLGHLDSVLKVDLGTFFINGSGIPTYHGHNYRIGRPVLGTFGSGGTAILMADPVYSDAGLYNEVRITRTASGDSVASDAASQRAYDVRTYSISADSGDYLPSAAVAAELASWIVSQRKEPIQRIASITLVPDLDPDVLWPHVLSAELGDIITISLDLPGTRGVTPQDYAIERIKHTGSRRHGHLTTWSLSRVPADYDEYFVIGSAVRGLIGVNKLAY